MPTFWRALSQSRHRRQTFSRQTPIFLLPCGATLHLNFLLPRFIYSYAIVQQDSTSKSPNRTPTLIVLNFRETSTLRSSNLRPGADSILFHPLCRLAFLYADQDRPREGRVKKNWTGTSRLTALFDGIHPPICRKLRAHPTNINFLSTSCRLSLNSFCGSRAIPSACSIPVPKSSHLHTTSRRRSATSPLTTLRRCCLGLSLSRPDAPDPPLVPVLLPPLGSILIAICPGRPRTRLAVQKGPLTLPAFP